MESKSVKPLLGEEAQHAVAERVRDTVEKATTPLQRWERYLESPVALLVMPIFALANAGIPIRLESLYGLWSEPLALGIMLGLVLGKVIGITFMTWLSLQLGLGQLSKGVQLRHIAGIGLLGGMGFTMSIFITNLGFESEPATLVTAKTAILFASLVAGVAGYLWLRLLSRGPRT
jgi:NhaA family Na+:H+ antiporter